jgi:hypothetical protein
MTAQPEKGGALPAFSSDKMRGTCGLAAFSGAVQGIDGRFEEFDPEVEKHGLL